MYIYTHCLHDVLLKDAHTHTHTHTHTQTHTYIHTYRAMFFSKICVSKIMPTSAFMASNFSVESLKNLLYSNFIH